MIYSRYETVRKQESELKLKHLGNGNKHYQNPKFLTFCFCFPSDGADEENGSDMEELSKKYFHFPFSFASHVTAFCVLYMIEKILHYRECTLQGKTNACGK